ncbi:MAG: hypothetical protein DRP42_07625 [Tenericutes bacterium]|nr:MAG: hypothetical protein DRP42_07625 [Mycoplasmatota bacterium]
MKELAAIPLWVWALQITGMIIALKLVHGMGYYKGFTSGRIFQMKRGTGLGMARPEDLLD